MAHNCHGKTKSHGTTNFTHGITKLTHGKTKKTSWSAVGQWLLFASEMVNRVTVTHCSLEKPSFFELTMFCSACGSVVVEDANFEKGNTVLMKTLMIPSLSNETNDNEF